MNKAYSVSENFLIEKKVNSTLVIPNKRNYAYTLNDTAADILQLIKADKSLNDIIKKFRRKYKDLPKEKISYDIKVCLKELEEIELIKEA